MDIHLLSGFLGSGKTTAIQSACRRLIGKGISTAVISNDQGIKLVDAGFFEHLGIPGRQVLNGCFCCNYQDLDDQIQSLMDAGPPQQIFAESVGSCTDIIATVLKPLRRFRPQARTTLTVFADALLLHMLLVEDRVLFDDAVQYIYDKQLEEAGILVLNKVDLLNPEQLRAVSRRLEEKYGGKIIHRQHAGDAASVDRWLKLLDRAPALALPASLDIDYPLYGAGEARLAWLDQEITIEDPSGGANQAALRLLEEIHRRIREKEYPIGHLKFLLNGRDKISFSALSQTEPVPVATPATGAFLLLNARVQTDPESLSGIVAESIRDTAEKLAVRIRTRSLSAFQPGYPSPSHRMV